MKKNKVIIICICSIVIGVFSSCATKSAGGGMSNMVATMEVKTPIDGVCDNSHVYAILPFPGNGQIKAGAPKTDQELTQLLNVQVSFLKDKSDYEDKGMVSLIINCKGEMVRCMIDNKTKSPELDSQIVAVFSQMKKWTAGTINGKSVDTVELYSFSIKKGTITIE